jgi:hypothetical protein
MYSIKKPALTRATNHPSDPLFIAARELKKQIFKKLNSKINHCHFRSKIERISSEINDIIHTPITANNVDMYNY